MVFLKLMQIPSDVLGRNKQQHNIILKSEEVLDQAPWIDAEVLPWDFTQNMNIQLQLQ